MSNPHDIKVPIAINWYVKWIEEFIPQLMEILGGGPGGGIGPLASVAKTAKPAERELMLAGINRIIASAEGMKKAINAVHT